MAAVEEFSNIEPTISSWSRSWSDDYGSDEDDSASPPLGLFRLPGMPPVADLSAPTAQGHQTQSHYAGDIGHAAAVSNSSSGVPIELTPSVLFGMATSALASRTGGQDVRGRPSLNPVQQALGPSPRRDAAAAPSLASMALSQSAVVQCILEAFVGRLPAHVWDTSSTTLERVSTDARGSNASPELALGATLFASLMDDVAPAIGASVREMAAGQAYIPVRICVPSQQMRAASISVQASLQWATQCLNDTRYAKWFATSVLSWCYDASTVASTLGMTRPTSANPALSSLLTHMQLSGDQATSALPVLSAIFGPTVAVMARSVLDAVQALEMAASSALSYLSMPSSTQAQALTLTTLKRWIDTHAGCVRQLLSILEAALDPVALTTAANRCATCPQLQDVPSHMRRMHLALECLDAIPAVAALKVLQCVADAVDMASARACSTVPVRAVRKPASGTGALVLEQVVQALPPVKLEGEHLPPPRDWQEILHKLLGAVLTTYFNGLQFALLGSARAPSLTDGPCVPSYQSLAELPLRPPHYAAQLSVLAQHITNSGIGQGLALGDFPDVPGLSLQLLSAGEAAVVLRHAVPNIFTASAADSRGGDVLQAIAGIPGLLAVSSQQAVVTWLQSLAQERDASMLDVEATLLASHPVFRTVSFPTALGNAGGETFAKKPAAIGSAVAVAPAAADMPLQPQRLQYEEHEHKTGSSVADQQIPTRAVTRPVQHSTHVLQLGTARVEEEISTVSVKMKPVFGPGYAPAHGTARSAWWDIDAQQDVKKEADAVSTTATADNSVLPSTFSMLRSSSSAALEAIHEEEDGEEWKADKDERSSHGQQSIAGIYQAERSLAHDENEEEDTEEADVVDWNEDGVLVHHTQGQGHGIATEHSSDHAQEVNQVRYAQDEPPLGESGFFADITSRFEAAAETGLAQGSEPGATGRTLFRPWDTPFAAWDWLAEATGDRLLPNCDTFSHIKRTATVPQTEQRSIEGSVDTVSALLARSVLGQLAAQARLCSSLAVHVLLSPDGCRGKECLQVLRDVAVGTTGPLLFQFTHALFESMDRSGSTEADMGSLARLMRARSSAALTLALRSSLSAGTGASSSYLAAHTGRFEMTLMGSLVGEGQNSNQPPEQWLRDSLSLHYNVNAQLIGVDAVARTGQLLSAYLLPAEHLSGYGKLFTHVVLYLGYADYKVQAVTKAARRAHDFLQELLEDLCWSRAAGLPPSLLRQLPQLQTVCSLLPALQQARHIALQLVTATRQHISMQVADRPWTALVAALDTARTCEDVRTAHDAYMRSALHAALLGASQAAPRAALHGLIGRALNLCRQIEAAYVICVQQLESVRTAIEDDLNAESMLGGGAAEGDDRGVLGEEGLPKRKRTKAYREGHVLHASTIEECTMPLLAVVRQLTAVQSSFQSLQKQAVLAVKAGRLAGATAGSMANAARSTGLEALLALVDFNGYFQRL